MGDLLWLAHHVASLGDHLDHALLRAEYGEAREFGVALAASLARDPRGVLEESSVAADHGARGKVEFAPPDHVGRIAERTDHRDARALISLCERVRENGHLDLEQGREHRRAE